MTIRCWREESLGRHTTAVQGNALNRCADVTAPAPPPNRIRGADLSFTLQLEACAATVSDRGHAAAVERLLAVRGANVVRLRAWVEPPSGYSDLRSALVLGRRAAAAGCEILLDLHYSDFWADVRNQAIPARWRGQDLNVLADTVRRYTREAVAAFADQGTPLSMIQIGNEVTRGMLWPLGRVSAGSSAGWDELVVLLRAGLDGAHDAGGDGLRTMLHVDCGGDRVTSQRFLDQVLGRGVDFSLVGLSYYPFWHGPSKDLRENLHALAQRYHKDIVVVETAYPWTLQSDDGAHRVVSRATQLPESDRFAATAEGQAAYFEDLRATIESVPGAHGAGFVAWEPAWSDEVAVVPGGGNPYANLTMFDRCGRGLPSLAAFRA